MSAVGYSNAEYEAAADMMGTGMDGVFGEYFDTELGDDFFSGLSDSDAIKCVAFFYFLSVSVTSLTRPPRVLQVRNRRTPISWLSYVKTIQAHLTASPLPFVSPYRSSELTEKNLARNTGNLSASRCIETRGGDYATVAAETGAGIGKTS
jgi:hypothetical protein